jgi:hypothetical protein
MDFLTFIDHLIASLVWPVAIVLFVFLFREEIKKALVKVSKINVPGGGEIEFSEALNDAEKKADEAKLPDVGTTTAQTAPLADEKGDLPELLIHKYPEAAISESWRKVENAAADKYGIRGKTVIVVPDEIRPVYEELRQLKNRAIHAPPGTITSAEAERYIELSKRVLAQIANVDPPPLQPGARFGHR